MTEKTPTPESKITGQVERITYHDPASGFTVAQVRPIGDGSPVTVVGHLMAPPVGTVLQMSGQWAAHSRFGRQFKVAHHTVTAPATREGVEKYLGSGLIKGIGPATAKRIVGCFGDQTLDIIDRDPDKLKQVPGIGSKKAQSITKAWQAQREVRNVMLFLQSQGVSSAYATRIYRHYGDKTIGVVRKNPYRLADDISGIGFLIADAIAGKMGMAQNDPHRLQAGIRYLLNRLADEGHLYFPHGPLVGKAQALLKTRRETITAALGALTAARRIVIENLDGERLSEVCDDSAVYLAKYHASETFIAQRLCQLLAQPVEKAPTAPDQAVAWVQDQLQLHLAGRQLQAVAGGLTHKAMVITGGPGTGKTTIVRAITRIHEHLQARVLLAAPTGRAAKRLGDTTGRSARTIHRLLEYNPREGGFGRNRRNPLDADLLVIDEVSMIDAVLMYHLLQALPLSTTLILVGDVNQLPSVGPGNLLKDILSSAAVPRVTLKQIFRQARQSRIITSAHRINAGHLPDVAAVPPHVTSDFYFIEQADPEKILDTILTLVRERIPQRFQFDPIEDIQVLTPMHRGVVGAENLNLRLQQALNPQQAYVSKGQQRFGLHDKVMQLRNNYDKQVFNGDIGRITHIDPHRKRVTIEHDARSVGYDFEEMEELTLAYAVSVHKSQGSEYPAVVIPVTTQHYLLLQRNLIYTAVTRARRLVVLVGTKRALAIAVKNNAPQRRYTGLTHRLRSLCRPSGSQSPQQQDGQRPAAPIQPRNML